MPASNPSALGPQAQVARLLAQQSPASGGSEAYPDGYGLGRLNHERGFRWLNQLPQDELWRLVTGREKRLNLGAAPALRPLRDVPLVGKPAAGVLSLAFAILTGGQLGQWAQDVPASLGIGEVPAERRYG